MAWVGPMVRMMPFAVTMDADWVDRVGVVMAAKLCADVGMRSYVVPGAMIWSDNTVKVCPFTCTVA